MILPLQKNWGNMSWNLKDVSIWYWNTTSKEFDSIAQCLSQLFSTPSSQCTLHLHSLSLSRFKWATWGLSQWLWGLMKGKMGYVAGLEFDNTKIYRVHNSFPFMIYWVFVWKITSNMEIFRPNFRPFIRSWVHICS